MFAGQIGLPVPAMLFLMMAGALGASGKLSLLAIILTSITGCLVADFAWSQAGRWWGSRILRILCSFNSDRRYCVQRARDAFARWGLHSLVIAKFVPGLDGLMPPLAGLERAGVMEFLLFDAIGSVLWSSVYCLAGYLFADHIEVVAAALRRLSYHSGGATYCPTLLLSALAHVGADPHGAPTENPNHYASAP